ncbi:MAG: hypothetical protein J6562_05520, partial [Candidatus Schmidhempelia sp.]|nr:hypothetical protein [Candidatus Schmidhempelia sp.]
TPSNIKVKSAVFQKMGPASLFASITELPLGAVALSDELSYQLNIKITDIPGKNGINYVNSAWRIVLANSPDQALMTDEIIAEGKTTQDGALDISANKSKELIARYNKSPGYLWIVTNNMAYQLQLSTLDGVDKMQKNIKAAQAMGYNANIIRQQDMFLNAVQNNSLIEKNQFINSIKK